MGDLWAFYKRVSIIMLQKSSARKGFCAEGWRFLSGKWYMLLDKTPNSLHIPIFFCTFVA